MKVFSIILLLAVINFAELYVPAGFKFIYGFSAGAITIAYAFRLLIVGGSVK